MSREYLSKGDFTVGWGLGGKLGWYSKERGILSPGMGDFWLALVALFNVIASLWPLKDGVLGIGPETNLSFSQDSMTLDMERVLHEVDAEDEVNHGEDHEEDLEARNFGPTKPAFCLFGLYPRIWIQGRLLLVCHTYIQGNLIHLAQTSSHLCICWLVENPCYNASKNMRPWFQYSMRYCLALS